MNTRCKFHYKSGSYSGRIDDNYPRQWSKYVYSDTWTPINNSQDTYYTVSGWVKVISFKLRFIVCFNYIVFL